MPASLLPLPSLNRCHGHCHALPGPAGGARTARLRPPSALNNQHSHVEEELARMQAQLRSDEKTRQNAKPHSQEHHHHVFVDTDHHPHQRHPRRVHRVHHEVHQHTLHHHHHHAAPPAEDSLTSAVELSFQYSSNIVTATDLLQNHQPQTQQLPPPELGDNGRPITSVPRPPVLYVRVPEYDASSTLARDIVSALLRGDKLLMELPDEPGMVSTLLTALGHASAKLAAAGLATALDPICDPAAFSQGTCNTGYHHVSSSTGNGSPGGSPGGGSPSGSPSSSHDHVPAATSSQRPSHPSRHAHNHAHAHNHHDCCFVLCARAVPIPPQSASSPAAGGYTVGMSMGQEVLRVGPTANTHTLLPALLRSILRDGLVTLRTTWFDEEIESDSWSDDEEEGAHRHRRGSGQQQEGRGRNGNRQLDGSGSDGEAFAAAVAAAVATAAGASYSPTASFEQFYEREHHHNHLHNQAPPPPPQEPQLSHEQHIFGHQSHQSQPHQAQHSHQPHHQPLQPHGVRSAAGGSSGSVSPTGSFSPTSSYDQGQGQPAGSLVRVPPVLRSIFKLDRQLRSLDLGGLVLLPHTFLRAGQGRANSPVLYLDVVIA